MGRTRSKVNTKQTTISLLGGLLAASLLAACGTAAPTTSLSSSSAASATSSATTSYTSASSTASSTTPGSQQSPSVSPTQIPEEQSSCINVTTGACWAKIAGTPVSKVVIGSMPLGASATWKAAWTPQALYVYANVVTPGTPVNTNTSALWEDDGVEIYLSGTNDHSGPYPKYTGQLLVNSAGLTNSTLGTDHTLLPTPGAKATEQMSSTGYQILLSLPWSDLGVKAPAQGTKIGFTLAVDFAGTGAVSRAKGGAQVTWYGTVNNWDNDSAWGILQLA